MHRLDRLELLGFCGPQPLFPYWFTCFVLLHIHGVPATHQVPVLKRATVSALRVALGGGVLCHVYAGGGAGYSALLLRHERYREREPSIFVKSTTFLEQ